MDAKARWQMQYRQERINGRNVVFVMRGKYGQTLSDVVAKTLSGRDPVYEPKERLCGGVYGFVRHRFPIRGGITSSDVMADNLRRHNALLRRLMQAK